MATSGSSRQPNESEMNVPCPTSLVIRISRARCILDFLPGQSSEEGQEKPGLLDSSLPDVPPRGVCEGSTSVLRRSVSSNTG